MGLAIAESGVPRHEMFLTSKLHPSDLGYANTMLKFEESIQDLQTNYLDLFLLHYPRCWGTICGGVVPDGTWESSWKALEDLVEEGKIKDIGMLCSSFPRLYHCHLLLPVLLVDGNLQCPVQAYDIMIAAASIEEAQPVVTAQRCQQLFVTRAGTTSKYCSHSTICSSTSLGCYFSRQVNTKLLSATCR